MILLFCLLGSAQAMFNWQQFVPGFQGSAFGVPNVQIPGWNAGAPAAQIPGQNSWGWSMGGSIGSSASFQMGPDGQWHKVTGDVQGKIGTAEASNVDGEVKGSGGAIGGGFSGSYDPVNGWQSSNYGSACTTVLENGVQTLKCDNVPQN